MSPNPPMTMSRPEPTRSDRVRTAATPAFCLLMAVIFFAAAAAGGQPGLGAGLAVCMVLGAVGFWIAGRRSETMRGLMDHRDERLTRIDVEATAFSGLVLILVLIALMVAELARGNSGSPYSGLAGVAGLAYIAAVAWRRFRG